MNYTMPRNEEEITIKNRTIRSYVKRVGRVTSGQIKAFQELGPKFLFPFQLMLQTNASIFGSKRANQPLVLEIGFGMGEATSKIALLLPEINFLCCEVHEPGIGALLKLIGEHDIENIKICAHDAVEVINAMLPDGILDGIHIFFPDPWHKARHNKRRLIQQCLVQKLARRLKPGGYIHCATDWQPYAEQILAVLTNDYLLKNRFGDGYATKPAYRPLTKFEHRGLKLGHGVWDVVFERI
jgi:tRNA (guanine-N7-)-methyltransferase